MATIKFGLVGCGGRGRGAAKHALLNAITKDVKLVAVADAFEGSVNSTVQMFTEEFPDQTDLPKERQFAGLDCCERLLETDCDVVLLCEPPGFRPRHCIAAVESGKHVFIEKPVAVDAPGVRMIMAANAKAKANGKQILFNGHEMRLQKKFQEPIKMIHDGAIGKLTHIRIFFNTGGLWTRPRREDQTEMQYQVSNWYYFVWLSGDHIVEQHVHDIDMMNWIMQDKHPIEANGMGGRNVRIGPEFGEIFDHHSVEYVFDDGVRGFSNCRQINGCWGSYSEHAYGTKGYVDMDGTGEVRLYINGQEPKIWKHEGNEHQLEMDCLFDAVVNGNMICNGDIAAQSTMTAVLGRMATYSGKVVKWDDAIKSELDTFPKSLAWDADPGPKPDAYGIYPCAQPGVTVPW